MKGFNYSVIVPYRDKYELFIQAVNSIPDRGDIQIIIVDNSPCNLSVDEIPIKDYSKVTYCTSSKTKGAGCARNVGLQLVEGEYVLFLDADDFFTADAFSAFDKYLDKDFDIVFFNSTSIRLKDGSLSNRHLPYSHFVEKWVENRDERKMRYRWPVPWAKLYRYSFIKKGGFRFEEIYVLNDAWFSVTTGHSANKICGDTSIVYVVTEAANGQSLVKIVSRDFYFSRYCTRIRINKYLKRVGRYDMHIRLLGSLHSAFKYFGFKELLRYLYVARKYKVDLF